MAKEETKEKTAMKATDEKETPKKVENPLDETTDQPDDAAVDSQLEINISNEYKLPETQEQHPLSHHSMKKVIIAGLIVVLLAIIGGAVLWSTHDEPVSTGESEIIYTQGAAVTAVEGTVEYNTGAGWSIVESGINLEEGDSLRTLEASRAIITLDEGSAIRLNGDTTVTLTKLTTEEVIVDNETGQVYTRVVPSENRVFIVTVGEENYEALGTAYKTVNEEEEKGVEVYHSKVKTKDSKEVEKEIGEGEAFYSKNKDKDHIDKISKLDLEKLKDDAFLKWNKTKDEAEKEFSDKLGFLKDIDQPKEKPDPDPTPKPTPAVTPDGISAWGTKVDDGIKVSWSVKNVATNSGFKVAYSTDDTTPSYPGNSYKYIGDSNATSVVLSLTDGKTYHVRVCAYRPESEVKCATYSNTVSVTAPYKEKEKVTHGAITISGITDDTISWSYTGKAPYGYKVTWNKTGSPEYGKDSAKLVGGTSLNLADKISEAGDYYVRVCAYTSGTEAEKCVDYTSAPGEQYHKN